MGPNEELGGLKRSLADLKVTARIRIGALQKGLRGIRDDLGGLDARLRSMESDLTTIKEHLVTRMQSSESKDDDEDGPGGGETAERSCRLRIDPQFVAESLNLTPKESLVAVALARGSSVRDIAAAMGRKEGTIRSLLKKINRKLGISRQAQLVRMILLLPHRNGERVDNGPDELATCCRKGPRGRPTCLGAITFCQDGLSSSPWPLLGAREATGTASCWSDNFEGRSTSPGGLFAAGLHTCGMREEGAVTCWGGDAEGRYVPPCGACAAVSGVGFHACGVGGTRSVICRSSHAPRKNRQGCACRPWRRASPRKTPDGPRRRRFRRICHPVETLVSLRHLPIRAFVLAEKQGKVIRSAMVDRTNRPIPGWQKTDLGSYSSHNLHAAPRIDAGSEAGCPGLCLGLGVGNSYQSGMYRLFVYCHR